MTDYYSLLSRSMREYVYKNKWPSLTKIQAASIKGICTSDNNLILVAPTAQGKTEAAFLPAISTANDFSSGLRILYISPLIALINDQFKRVEKMCEDLNIPVTSWHGEASKTKKDKLVANPSGIVLITPESLEALFVNRANDLDKLFGGLDYIIVDEIHGFLSGNRGVQLKSLLTRILKYTAKTPRYIGLSATIGDANYKLAKEFFNNGKDTNILIDQSKNDLVASISYIEEESITDKTIERILRFSQDGSMLVFPNSRKNVENLAVSLRKKADDLKMSTEIFAHHSSVSKQRRKEIENFAKRGDSDKFIICATSTLELGIDIGSVHSICQYGSTYSVLSLAQRLGRSGRKTHKSILHQIATNPWDLVQALATISLYKEGNLDEICQIQKPYDVFAHQILSELIENNGLKDADYNNLITKLSAFSDISNEEFNEITSHLLENSFIEKLEDEYIIGLEAEKLLKMGSFYNQFVSTDNFSVYSNKAKIGEIEKNLDLKKGDNIYLSGLVWKIDSINIKSKKILVIKAEKGEAVSFGSNSGEDISNEIREKMEEIIIDRKNYSYNDKINNILDSLYVGDEGGFYLINDEKGQGLRTFKGGKINRTLTLMLNIRSINNYKQDERSSTIIGKNIRKALKKIITQKVSLDEIKSYLDKNPKQVESYLSNNKYKNLIPQKLKSIYIINNLLDLDGAYEFLDK